MSGLFAASALAALALALYCVWTGRVRHGGQAAVVAVFATVLSATTANVEDRPPERPRPAFAPPTRPGERDGPVGDAASAQDCEPDFRSHLETADVQWSDGCAR